MNADVIGILSVGVALARLVLLQASRIDGIESRLASVEQSLARLEGLLARPWSVRSICRGDRSRSHEEVTGQADTWRDHGQAGRAERAVASEGNRFAVPAKPRGVAGRFSAGRHVRRRDQGATPPNSYRLPHAAQALVPRESSAIRSSLRILFP